MSKRIAVGLAILAAFGLGVATIQGLGAKGTAPVFLVAEVEVTDLEGYTKEYVPLAQKSLETSGGRILAASQNATAIEGGIKREAVPRVIAVSAVVAVIVMAVIFARPAVIGVFAAGIGVELARAAAHVLATGIGVKKLTTLPPPTYLPPGLVWNLATLPPPTWILPPLKALPPMWPPPPLKPPPRPASAEDIAPIRTKQAATPIASARLMRFLLIVRLLVTRFSFNLFATPISALPP